MDNVVVFDYISADVAKDILRLQVNKVINNFKLEKQIKLSLSDKAFNTLYEKATLNLEDGGRGIGNALETYLINPLSSYMFNINNKVEELEITNIIALTEDDVIIECK